MKRTGIIVAMLAVSSVAFAQNAHAGIRWPWEGRNENKPAAMPTPRPVIRGPVGIRLPPTVATPPAVALTPEQQFAQDIHEVNQKEIAMGNLALQRASDERVKEFGRMLVTDHTKADATFGARATELGMKLAPVTVPDADYAALTAKSGPDFDIGFLDAMVRAHDALIPGLARFKEQEGNHPFHAQIADLFDTVKHHRAEAKALLDRARSERQNVNGKSK